MSQPAVPKAAQPAHNACEPYSHFMGVVEAIEEGAGIALWDHDLRTNIVVRSPRWAKMLGYEPGELDHRADVWKSLIHDDDLPAVDRACKEHEAGELPLFRVEHRLRTKEGGWKWVLNWGKVVERDGDGRALRAVGIHLDISDRKRFEADIVRSAKVDTVGTLAGGIAHDFNNVLAVILGNVTLAQTRVSETDVLEWLNAAEEAVFSARRLTNQLLAFSKGGAPVMEPVDIGETIEKASRLALCGSNTRVEIDIQEDVWNINGSVGQIDQVVTNLLLNASQAMPDGGVVKIVARNRDECPDSSKPRRCVEVEISDSGHGISEADVNRVFDPFFTTKPKGTGLGLAVVHAVVKNHRGSVHLSSSPGQGATFTLQFEATDQAPAATARSSVRAPSEPGGKLLLIEDDPSVGRMTKHSLEVLGYSVNWVQGGGQAVSVFCGEVTSGHGFDLVIADLTIPGEAGGVEIVSRLRQIDPNIPSIICSGYFDDQVLNQYEEYGFQGVLLKPFTMTKLKETVGRVIAESKVHRSRVAGRPK